MMKFKEGALAETVRKYYASITQPAGPRLPVFVATHQGAGFLGLAIDRNEAISLGAAKSNRLNICSIAKFNGRVFYLLTEGDPRAIDKSRLN